MVSLKERYEAAMVLSGTGDAVGYKDGEWEFCHSGKAIYKELMSLGGLNAIQVKLPLWPVSDDTVMHLATGEALSVASNEEDKEKLFLTLAQNYKECMSDMTGRAPGNTCMMGTSQLRPFLKKGYQIPFNPRGGGCGAAMRAMCIGLRYPRPSDITDLVAVSVEAGRMTHHNPTGFLGSLASALFTSLAIQGRPLREWGRCLLDTLPLAMTYLEETGFEVEENKKAWSYFSEAWTKYLTTRNLLDGKSDPVFPDSYNFDERDRFYKDVSFSGWGGSSGHDAPMIAYDAMLGANWDWQELCKRGMFHGGDSDSTGVIVGCCYGATKGFQGVPEGNHIAIEYRSRLVEVADKLLQLAYPQEAGGGDDLSSQDISVTVESLPTADVGDSQTSMQENEDCQE